MADGEGKSPKVPEWLPDGWITKVNHRKSGKVDRYFVSPVSGRTFRSRVEVLRYLNVEKVDAHPAVTTAAASSEEDKPRVTECSEEDKPCDVEQPNTSPVWLPSGWVSEIKYSKNGAKAGRKYKCYIDPVTGSRFYSKAEVLHYLKTGKCSSSTSKKKKHAHAEPTEEHLCNTTSNQKSVKADSEDNIQSLIETSPDGLPPGWTKEVRCKRSASGIRKDPYYTDPVNGYVFRSKKDAFRYIETGEIGNCKHAIKPKSKRSANEMHSIENESPSPISAKRLNGEGSHGTTVKRRLFSGKARKSNRNATKESNELFVSDSCSPPSLPQCEQGAGPSYKTPSGTMLPKDKHKATGITILCESDLPDKPLEAAEEEALDQVIEKLLDSVSKHSPSSANGKLSDPATENLQNPTNMRWLEVMGKEALKPAGKVLSQSSEAVDNPTEQLPKKQLDSEGVKSDTIAKRKSVGSVPSSRKSRKKLSSEQPLEMRVDKKMELADQESSKTIYMHSDLEPEVKLVRGSLSEPNEVSKLASVETSGQGIEESKEEGKNSASGSKPRKSKTKSEKSTPIIRRASKRLAGLEVGPTADIEVSDRSLKRAKQSTQLKPSAAEISSNDSPEAEAELPKLKEVPLREQVKTEPWKTGEPLREQVVAESPKPNKEPLREQVDLEKQGGGEGSMYKDLECPMTSPFGDKWPDPCIEFAFKTLTGEIPVFTTIQGFLHEQLSSVQTPSGVAHSPVGGGCPNGPDQANAQMQVNSAGKDHSLLGSDDVSPQTSGKVKRLCRRSSSRITGGGHGMPVSATCLCPDPSSMGRVESCADKQGSPCKAKYPSVIDELDSLLEK